MKLPATAIAVFIAGSCAAQSVPHRHDGVVTSTTGNRHTIQLREGVRAREGSRVDFYFTVPGDTETIPVATGHIVAERSDDVAIALTDYGPGKPQPGNIALIRAAEPGDRTFHFLRDQLNAHRRELVWVCTAILILAILTKHRPRTV